jgi:hypothetical protein
MFWVGVCREVYNIISTDKLKSKSIKSFLWGEVMK